MKIIKLSTYLIMIMMFVIIHDTCCAKIGYHKAWYVVDEIKVLDEQIIQFHNDTGRYPDVSEGLEVLRTKPNNTPTWKGPYIRKLIQKDPWGNPYMYIYPARFGKKSYDLYSFGKNGQDDHGLKDDITNWQDFNGEYYGVLSKSENSLAYIGAIFLFIIVAFLLALVGKPTFRFLPRRFAFVTLFILLSGVIMALFFRFSQDRINAIYETFLVVFLFGFSLTGTIISLLSIKKGMPMAKALLFAGINILPFLLAGGVWIIISFWFL